MGRWVFKIPFAVRVLQHVQREIVKLQRGYFHLVMHQGGGIDHRVNLLGFHKIARGKTGGIPHREIIHANGDLRKDAQIQAPDLDGLPGLLLKLRNHLWPKAIDIEKDRNDDGQSHNNEDHSNHNNECNPFPFGHGAISWRFCRRVKTITRDLGAQGQPRNRRFKYYTVSFSSARSRRS